MTQITLASAILNDLRSLHSAKLAAERDFRIISNAMLMTLGLDPKGDHHLDLDTGVVTPAEPKEQEGG